MNKAQRLPPTTYIVILLAISFLPKVFPLPELFADEPICVVSLTGERRLDVYQIDSTGKLKVASKRSIESKPAASCFDPVGRHVYVTGNDPTTINVLRLERGVLTLLQTVPAPAKASYLRVTPSGRFLLASYFISGQATVHHIDAEGKLSKEPLQTLDIDPHAHCIACNLSGEFVFVPHTSVSRISQFKFHDKTGRLTRNSPVVLQRADGIAPRHLWFSPTGQHAFGSNEKGRSISVYSLDRMSGLLSERQTILSIPGNVEGRASTSRVEAHPSGRFVYIANRGHGTIAAFEFDQASEKLRLIQHAETGPSVRGFSISPDGRFLVVANLQTNKLQNFAIREDGTLKLVNTIDSGRSPWWVSFSPRNATRPRNKFTDARKGVTP